MPVYTHLVDDDITRQMARRIREARQRRGWTLQQLADKLSVSVATLSTIENRQVSPDIRLLVQISEALGTSVESLIPWREEVPFQITRRSELEAHPPASLKIVSRAHRTPTAYHNRLWPLADRFVGKYIEPYEIEIQPVRDRQLRFISHTHEEFFFVLRGGIEVLIKHGTRLLREKLGAGDCIYFSSYLPHCLRSTTATPARSVHVLSALDEPVDSETADWVTGPVIYMMESSRRSAADQVVAKIAALRHARGMPTAKFAKHLGISGQRLARIERGTAPVSFKLLLHVCRTFRKPLAYFLSTVTLPDGTHVVERAADVRRHARRPRRRQRPVVTDRLARSCTPKATVKPLASAFLRRSMFPYLISLDGASSRLHQTVEHPGQEFVYVLNGAVAFHTRQAGKSTSTTLSAGDSCLLDASVPHSFSAVALSPYVPARTEMIVVRWEGRFTA